MKAEIDEYGSLTISAETPLESYALARWHEGWIDQQPRSTLMINAPVHDAPTMTDGVVAVPALAQLREGK